jgi:hypothetical protein
VAALASAGPVGLGAALTGASVGIPAEVVVLGAAFCAVLVAAAVLATVVYVIQSRARTERFCRIIESVRGRAAEPREQTA